MISEFSINPKPQNDKAKHAVALLGTLGALIFGVSMFIESYRGIVALAAMIFIVAALSIAVKYLLSEYSYEVTEAGGEWLFVVVQHSGKRYTTLCRIELANVASIDKVNSKDAKKRETDFAYYAYIPTLMPDSYYVMKVVSRYEKSQIALELTDEMAELLRTCAREARESCDDQ